VRRLDARLAQAQHGPGTPHSVLYGNEAAPRNNVLQALIRLTIKEDGLKRPALGAKPLPGP
jgi:hypothetical protein